MSDKHYKCELCGDTDLQHLIGLCPCEKCIAKIRQHFPHYNKTRNELGDIKENSK